MNGVIKRRGVLTGAVATAAALSIGTRAAASKTIHEVRITGFAFVPARLNVKVGDKVRWFNDDLAPHTATADERGWDTGAIGKSNSAEITVTQDMETSYFCIYHPHMKGTLVLK